MNKMIVVLLAVVLSVCFIGCGSTDAAPGNVQAQPIAQGNNVQAGELGLTWYNNMDPSMTVEITNYLKDHATADEPMFYDIYTPEEKAADPSKEVYRAIFL